MPSRKTFVSFSLILIILVVLSGCSTTMEFSLPVLESTCNVTVKDTRLNEDVLDARLKYSSTFGTPPITQIKTNPTTTRVVNSYLCSAQEISSQILEVKINKFFCDAHLISFFAETTARFEINLSYNIKNHGLQETNIARKASISPGGNVTPHEICHAAFEKTIEPLLSDIKSKTKSME